MFIDEQGYKWGDELEDASVNELMSACYFMFLHVPMYFRTQELG